MRLRKVLISSNFRSKATALLGVSGLLFWGGTAVFAQAAMPMSDPPAQQTMANSPADQNQQLSDQVTELRGQVAKLQAALQRTSTGRKVSSNSGMKMAPASDKIMGMGDDGGEMGATPMGSKSSTSNAPASAMGMCCMGKMTSGANANMGASPSTTGGMAKMNGSSSAMSGQAGVSHLYHIGSNGFFLNQSRRISLTPDQRQTLNHLKEKATVENANDQRGIGEAEQGLYTLTGADQPNSAKIQAKIVEIEKLRGEQRMDFIRAVAEASDVLTPEQRKALLGA